jgi:hypothetical protein
MHVGCYLPCSNTHAFVTSATDPFDLHRLYGLNDLLELFAEMRYRSSHSELEVLWGLLFNIERFHVGRHSLDQLLFG